MNDLTTDKMVEAIRESSIISKQNAIIARLRAWDELRKRVENWRQVSLGESNEESYAVVLEEMDELEGK